LSVEFPSEPTNWLLAPLPLGRSTMTSPSPGQVFSNDPVSSLMARSSTM
jgi:hypothetical protein